MTRAIASVACLIGLLTVSRFAKAQEAPSPEDALDARSSPSYGEREESESNVEAFVLVEPGIPNGAPYAVTLSTPMLEDLRRKRRRRAGIALSIVGGIIDVLALTVVIADFASESELGGMLACFVGAPLGGAALPFNIAGAVLLARSRRGETESEDIHLLDRE